MPHKVEISDKTYEDLKEFCSLNDLKIGQFADKLIRDGLMIEMYGDVPFTNYRIKLPQEIKAIEAKGTLNKDGTFEQEAVKTVMAKLKERENPEAEAEIMDSGDIMFGNQDGVAGAIDKETKDRMVEVMEKVEAEHPQTYITNQEGEKEIQKEMLKQLGVPDKVVNKITKRRLK